MIYKCPTTAWYTKLCFFQFNSQENLQEGRSAQPRTSKVGGRSTYNPPPPPPSIETWEFKKLCKIDICGLAWNFVFYAIPSCIQNIIQFWKTYLFSKKRMVDTLHYSWIDPQSVPLEFMDLGLTMDYYRGVGFIFYVPGTYSELL